LASAECGFIFRARARAIAERRSLLLDEEAIVA
jgi:hypothetical protein